VFNYFNPDAVEDLNNKQCFELLSKYVGNNQPSFRLFSNFINFTFPQFYNVTILQDSILSSTFCSDGLFGLKKLVISLLLQTTKDFVIRNIEFNFEKNPSMEDYINRFKTLSSWEKSVHPGIEFK
jgi:hypothetical protein